MACVVNFARVNQPDLTWPSSSTASFFNPQTKQDTTTGLK